MVINRPPRDGRMAFVRSPDNVSIELLQKGEALAPAEPWASMGNTGIGEFGQGRLLRPAPPATRNALASGLSIQAKVNG